jgi:hypothetical protein
MSSHVIGLDIFADKSWLFSVIDALEQVIEYYL